MHFRLTWKKEWTWILIVFLTFRVIYTFLGVMAVSDGLPEPKAAFDQTLITNTDPNSEALVNVWLRWDTVWYLKIARGGYEPMQPTTAFQPLYPVLIKAASFLVGGNLLLGALLVSNLAAIITLMLLYELARHEKIIKTNAMQSVIAFLLFPSTFFIFAAYTESIFLMLVLATWMCARNKRWWAAGMLGALATLCRLQGALLTPVLLWLLLLSAAGSENLPPAMQLKSIWNMLFTTVGRVKAKQIFVQPASLGFALPAATLYIYTLWLRHGGLGSIPQTLFTHWGISTVMPWEGMRLFLLRLFTEPRVFIDFIDLGTLIIMLGMCLYATFRLDTAYTLYNWLNIGMFFMRGTPPHLLDSFNRYLLLLFPIFLIFGSLRSRKLVIIVGFLAFILELFLVMGFLDWGWVA